MSYQVIWANAAFDDLLEIEAFLGQPKADKIIERIMEQARQLSQFPEIGAIQEMPSHRRTYRFIIEGNYKIIYSFERKIVQICAVFDTRRDPKNLKL
jgi:plasmid stabilization system protein ParE